MCKSHLNEPDRTDLDSSEKTTVDLSHEHGLKQPENWLFQTNNIIYEGHRHSILRYRIPTEIVFSNSPCFPYVFPLSDGKFSLCDLWLLHTQNWLGRLTKLKKKNWRFSWQISKYLLPLESGNLQLERTKFPVFSLYFGKISKFPVFSLKGNSLCSGYPVDRNQ